MHANPEKNRPIILMDGTPLLADKTTGLERYVQAVVPRLLKKGCHVHLFFPARRKPDPITLKISEQQNLTLQTSPMTFPGALGRIFWFLFILPLQIRFLFPKNPDIPSQKTTAVPIFWGPCNRLPFFLPKHIKSVVTLHDLVAVHHPKTMRLAARMTAFLCLKPSLRQANRIAVISHATQQDLNAFMPKASPKTLLIPNGFDALICTQEAQNRHKNAHLFFKKDFLLHVGLLEPRKNQKRLLEAFARLPKDLQKKHPLVFVGPKGWSMPDLNGLIKTMDLQNSAVWLDYTSSDLLSFLYARCYFLAFPSLYEGFGLPLLEAMSHGKPVLTSNTSSMPQVAGPAGVFVNPTSVQSIQEGLTALLLDAAIYKKHAAAAPDHAARFSWDKTAASMQTLFQDLSGIPPQIVQETKKKKYA